MKIMRNIFICFIVVGLIGSLVMLIGYGFNFNRIWADMVHAEGYTFHYEEFSDIESITIRARNGRINVHQHEHSHVRIEYHTREERLQMTVAENNGALSLTQYVPNRINFGFSFTGTRMYSVNIFAPRDFNGVLDIETRNGMVDINGVNATKLAITTNNGMIDVANVVSDEMRFKADNGRIRARNIVAFELDVETNNGTIDIRGRLYHAQMLTRNGRIDVIVTNANAADYRVEMITRNGRTEFNGNRVSPGIHGGGPNHIRMETRNGRNTIRFTN